MAAEPRRNAAWPAIRYDPPSGSSESREQGRRHETPAFLPFGYKQPGCGHGQACRACATSASRTGRVSRPGFVGLEITRMPRSFFAAARTRVRASLVGLALLGSVLLEAPPAAAPAILMESMPA